MNIGMIAFDNLRCILRNNACSIMSDSNEKLRMLEAIERVFGEVLWNQLHKQELAALIEKVNK